MILKIGLILLIFLCCIQRGTEKSFSTSDNHDSSREKMVEGYDNFTCSEKWSCKDHEPNLTNSVDSREYFGYMNCYCDSLCAYFRDCCPDAVVNTQDVKISINVSRELIDCVSVRELSYKNALYVVTRCPPAWRGPLVRAKCQRPDGEDLLLNLIVTGVSTGLTYRNMYCAMCHEIEYIYWVPSVSCSYRIPVYDSIKPNTSIVETLTYPGCDLTFLPPNDTISYRPCLPYNIIETCDPRFNDSAITESCENSKSLEMVYTVNNTWRSPSCAKCNFESEMFCDGVMPSLSSDFVKRRGIYSFSILIDMNTRKASSTVGTLFKKTTRNVTEIHTCRDSEVFDPFSLHCKPVVCDPPLAYRDGLCRSNTSGNLTDCPRVELEPKEYTVLEDDTLVKLTTGRRYDESQYLIKGSSAFVCSNLTQNFTNTTVVEEVVMVLTFSLSEAIVSLIGLSISLIALLITIITHAAIKSLQNIPGKNLLSLSCALFVAELLMIIAPSAERVAVLCKSIAILMHYFFLAAFFWMNVMAADVWFTFSKSFVKACGSGRSSKRFCFYSVYSWGVPVIILVSALLVDAFISDSAFKPNYGVGLCWFSNKNALMAFFAVPLFLIILMNMTFFAVASKNIYEARRSSARHLQVNENSSPFLYMKLFFVMGLTWVVGFLASLVARAVLWYLFAILNTLQGFFIFLSFIATKKVLRLIRIRLMTLRRGQTTESNPPSTPTRSTSVPFKISSNARL